MSNLDWIKRSTVKRPQMLKAKLKLLSDNVQISLLTRAKFQ